ncbi:hypothetical protein [uncultured Rubinisphaera sp.]|uniref:hypothetical protein n=1 Tax=uncultured Rubinisphaera sp. TaxID=1678686 RepID=UPI0030D898E6
MYVDEWDGDVQSVCLRDCRIDFELCYIFRFQRRTVSFTEKGRQSASTLSLSFRNSISILLHVTAKSSGNRSACHDYYWLAFQLIEMTIGVCLSQTKLNLKTGEIHQTATYTGTQQFDYEKNRTRVAGALTHRSPRIVEISGASAEAERRLRDCYSLFY